MSMFIGLINYLLKPLRGCLWLFILLIMAVIFACVGLGVFAASRASAAPPPSHDIMLVVDQSPSLWNRDGVGSDPGMLRLSAVNLFLTYLGADDSLVRNRVGVIYFGGEARMIVPLTRLDASARTKIQEAIANPTPIPWTNPLAALLLAKSELVENRLPDRQGAIVLLTDGEPVIPNENPNAIAVYKQQITDVVQSLNRQEISFYVVLLENPAADNGSIESVWVPFWKDMTTHTPRGAFFLAQEAQELLDIYHEIVAGVASGEAGPQITSRRVSGQTIVSFTVPKDWSSMTLTAWQNVPEIKIVLYRPDGNPVDLSEANQHYVGDPGQSHENVWRFKHPTPGEWKIEVLGNGLITFWLDSEKMPPTSTPTSTNTPSPTATFTPTPIPTATPTPRPTAAIQSVTSGSRAEFTPYPFPSPLPPSNNRNKMPSLAHPTTKGALLTIAIILVLFSGILLKMRAGFQGQAAPVEGKLIVLQTPKDVLLPHIIDLSGRKQKKVVLAGTKRDADVFLPGWEGTIILGSYEENGEVYITLTVRKGHVIVNTYPVRDKVLNDGDEIALAGYRLRFSHLASARRAWKQRRAPRAKKRFLSSHRA